MAKQLDVSKVRMLSNQVLVEYDAPKEEAGEGSLIVKPATRYEVKFRGTVRAVGPGRWVPIEHRCGCSSEFKRVPVDVKPGDRVLFELGAGTLLDAYQGQNLLICEDTQLTAVLDEADATVLGEADNRTQSKLYAREKLTGHA